MAGAARDQALSLLVAANNHGDLAVKLSSFRQAKDLLLAIDPSLAAELFPYLADLQASPEPLVRKALVEAIEEIVLRAMKHASMLMPVLLRLINDHVSVIARHSIVTGTSIFCYVLEELVLQFHLRGIVERWFVELWTWMVKFKDAVLQILSVAGPVGPKLLAIKFLETYILLVTSDYNISEAPTVNGRRFNISWLVGGHPVLDRAALESEAYRSFGILLNMLRVAGGLPGSMTISVVNSTLCR